MGTSMASVAFRCSDKNRWKTIKAEILDMFDGVEGITSNLDTDGPGFAIVSPYGDMGMFLADLPEEISELTGDYAVMCACFDSDFGVMELYHNGQMLEECAIGEVYEEYAEFCCTNKANMALWSALLKDPSRMADFQNALHGEEVFVEDQLRVVSDLTGLPIFLDELVYGEA